MTATSDKSHPPMSAVRREVTFGKVFRGEIITLCGSTRFKNAFLEEQRALTLEGHIVISVGLFGHLDGTDIGTAEDPTDVKVMLDELHKRKIDLAERVHVINVDGYIGSSTRSEIDYARLRGKTITYLEQPEPAEIPG